MPIFLRTSSTVVPSSAYFTSGNRSPRYGVTVHQRWKGVIPPLRLNRRHGEVEEVEALLAAPRRTRRRNECGFALAPCGASRRSASALVNLETRSP
jgi:hypothetical protein